MINWSIDIFRTTCIRALPNIRESLSDRDPYTYLIVAPDPQLYNMCDPLRVPRTMPVQLLSPAPGESAVTCSIGILRALVGRRG